jgi:hypothetical protein
MDFIDLALGLMTGIGLIVAASIKIPELQAETGNKRK